MIGEAIARLIEGRSLGEEEAMAVMAQILAGQATSAQIGAFLVALRMKGETVEELTGFARAIRRNATPVRSQRAELIDISGTGGDRTGTFNISTTAALVVAGAGLAVAKHVDYSVSSRCGSADLLQALGVNLELGPDEVARCIDEVGIGFLFVPRLHPALKYVSASRRELGIRTVFDLLGPLVNPAQATARLLGIYTGTLTELVAEVLRALGSRSAFVVYGADGLDELSTTGVNKISRLGEDGITTFPLDSTELNLPRASLADLRGGSPKENVNITLAILEGEKSPRRDIVLLNAAAALVTGGKVSGLREAVALAAETIDSGRAKEKLAQLVDFSHRL
ncbi:MAG: anthranilate phosphoribosyltransferase [Anaerolineae bacterium]